MSSVGRYCDPIITCVACVSVEIEATYEIDRMLGSGEVIGKLQRSWNELLDRGDEPFGENKTNIIRRYCSRFPKWVTIFNSISVDLPLLSAIKPITFKTLI
ncbi:hypothetical protein EDD22DRAFT_849381 [Suillus occidentalis]|nr:hypothetical protein EDD22DRAFT_849381 [Suillus occidentalis]